MNSPIRNIQLAPACLSRRKSESSDLEINPSWLSDVSRKGADARRLLCPPRRRARPAGLCPSAFAWNYSLDVAQPGRLRTDWRDLTNCATCESDEQRIEQSSRRDASRNAIA